MPEPYAIELWTERFRLKRGDDSAPSGRDALDRLWDVSHIEFVVLMTDFDRMLRDLEADAEKAGPQAVAELRALGVHYAFAAELIAARRAARMTQTLLAERAGVPQSEISRFERGQGNPTIETVGRLFAALGRRVASAPVDTD